MAVISLWRGLLKRAGLFPHILLGFQMLVVKTELCYSEVPLYFVFVLYTNLCKFCKETRNETRKAKGIRALKFRDTVKIG